MSTEFETSTIQRCPHDKENPYAQISRDLIRDNSISPECRWLLIYLLSMSDTWKVNIKQIMGHLKGFAGRDKVYAIINEAIEAGYMKRIVVKKGNIKQQTNYFISESPKFKSKSRLPENPDVGNTIDSRLPDFRDPENTYYKKEHSLKKENKEKKQQQAPSGAKVCDAVVAFYECLEEIGLTKKQKEGLLKYPESEVKDAVAFATHPSTKIKTSLIQTIMWALKEKPDIPETIDAKANEKYANLAENTLKSDHWKLDALSKKLMCYSDSPGNSTCYEILYTENKFKEKLDKLLKDKNFKIKKDIRLN